MIIHLHLFARARDLIGRETCDVELPDDATVADLRHRLAADYPKLVGLLERSALAVNDDFADDARRLTPNDDVAVLPPVSGGSRQCSLGPPC